VLAPGVPAFPMEIEDVEAATRFAVAHALEWNADPTRVAYLGGSAGGQLAAMAAVNLDQILPGAVAKVVTLSGPFELPDPIEDEEWPQYVGPALGCAYKGRGCLGSISEAAEYSPALQLQPSNCSASWLMFNSSEELTRLDQPQKFKAALDAEGCSATLRVLAGKAHSFAYWRTAMPEIVEFLR
jgi:acetyl esterase/lipase